MAQSGGPTTESGILFQNSIAALFLGDLLHPIQKLTRQTVVAVRVEAPTKVDDTVVTYGDGHRVFIQAKESLKIQLSKAGKNGNEDDIELDEEDDTSEEYGVDESTEKTRPKKVAWVKLWEDFEAQFFESDFQRKHDRLCLYLGHTTGPLDLLRELCASAWGSNDAGDWFDNLPKKQKELVEKSIRPLLKDEHKDFVSLWELLRHIDVEVDNLKRIEAYLAPLRMPNAKHKSEDYNAANLFDFLLAECGRHARIRKQFDAANLLKELKNREIEIESSPAIDRLQEEVKAANLVLLNQRVTIGQKGKHLPREVTKQIVDWLTRSENAVSSDPKEERVKEVEEKISEVAFLHDIAGMGKTVVMHDVLKALDGKVPVIAIKADNQLLRLKQGESLERCLGFSQSLPRVAYRLAQDSGGGQAVVLLDQVDALSMALARDQDALDKISALVDQLRATPGVRVLISCRTFDLNTDPTLKQLPRKIEFALEPFSPDETESHLRAMGVEATALSPETRELLRVPLHLDLLALALEHQPEKLHSEVLVPMLGGVQTLQDLHTLLWEKVVEDERLDTQDISRRIDVVRLLADEISKSNKLTVPSGVLTSSANARLRPVAQSLASAGLLVNENQGWRFWHQTFFDYVSARTFVEEGRSLSHSILNGEQGLPERPRMLQILTYLRGKDSQAYVKEIVTLFESSDLADHLSDLLMRWFGALNSPDDQDWFVAQLVAQDNALRVEFLRRAEVSCGWFSYLQTEILPELFETGFPDEDHLSANESAGRHYLRAMLNLPDCQAEVAQFLTPYLDRSERWNHHLAWLLALVVKWHSEKAIALYKEVCVRWLQNKISGDYSLLEQLVHIAAAPNANTPLVVCQILELWFQRVLTDFDGIWNALQATSNTEEAEPQKDETGGDERLSRLLEEMHASQPKPLDAFNEHNFHYILENCLEVTAQREPEAFLSFLVPVIERVMVWTCSNPRFGYPHDPLSWVSYQDVGGHSHRSTECLLRDSCLAACQALQSEPHKLRPFIQRLRALPFSSPQALVATFYRVAPRLFAVEAAEFLLEDARRLWLGFGSQIDSALLLRAIFPFLNALMRLRLEEAIAKLEVVKRATNDDLSDLDLTVQRGRGQLRLLLSLERNLLGPETLTLLEDLKQQHPEMDGYIPEEKHNVASHVVAGFAGASPQTDVSTLVEPILSDEDWVQIIQRHTNREREVKNLAAIGAKGESSSDESVAQIDSSPVAETQNDAIFDLDALDLFDEGYAVTCEKLKPIITAEPERFARLALQQLPVDTETYFACAFIEGLADSSLPSGQVFEIMHHFEPSPDWPMGRFWQSACEIIQSRGQKGVPTEIVAMLERHLHLSGSSSQPNEGAIRPARSSPNPKPQRRIDRSNPFAPAIEVPSAPDAEAEDEFEDSMWINMGPMSEYLNWWPTRAIWSALLFALETNESVALSNSNAAVAKDYQERRWTLIGETANHSSKVVRCAGLIALLSLFGADRLRAFDLYEKLVEGYPDLLAMPYSIGVLWRAIVWFYDRTLPYIDHLLNAERAAFAQRGATLATLAAWHDFDAHRPTQLIQGRPAWRRGVAKIWAEGAFVSQAPTAKRLWCRDGLISLLSDDDPFVQRRLALVTRNLKSIHWNDWQPFLLGLLQSPALPECFDALTKFLWEHGKTRRASVLLPMIESLCNNSQRKEYGLNGFGGDELVRCVLNVYNSPLTSVQEKKKCVELFGRLLKRFPNDGDRAINEWDKSHFTWG
jgi:hypothetical protein